MKEPEEKLTLRVRPRAVETIAIDIPIDTLDSIKNVAASRDMAHQALLKWYIGQGLRQDLAKRFTDRFLETAADVLTRHIQSEEEVSTILREIRLEADLPQLEGKGDPNRGIKM